MIQPLLTEEAKKDPEKVYQIGYILYIEGDMPYRAIEAYLHGLGYPLLRKMHQKVVEKTLESKSRPSLTGLPGGGYSEGVALPVPGRPSKFLR